MMFLALVALWKERNMPDESMGLTPNGKTLNSILEELRCLEETKTSWVFSFQTKKQHRRNLKNGH